MSQQDEAPPAPQCPIFAAEFPGPVGEPRIGMAAQLGQERTIIASGEWGALGAMWIVPASDAPMKNPPTADNVGPGPGVFLLFSSLQGIESMRESLAVVEKHVRRCQMKIYGTTQDGEVVYLAARDIGHARAIYAEGPGDLGEGADAKPGAVPLDCGTVAFEELTPRQAGDVRLAGKMTLWSCYLALDGKARKIARVDRDKYVELFFQAKQMPVAED